MGLFDFIRNEFIEVIDWVDNSTDTLIFKFQDKENNIKNGAQLTVRETQRAILMNEGEFGDEYQPGLHALTTKNMPITTTLKSWKFGFDSPFKVDIYFISTKQFTNLKWGTAGPILMRDAEFGNIRLKSFGNFAIRIKDAKKFITEFSGTNPIVKIDQIQETIQAILASKLGAVFAKAEISVMDLAAHFSTLGEKIMPILQVEMDEFGILLESFFIEHVSLPDEVEKILDKKTELNILKGNLNEFNQMQGGIAIEKMAENETGGGIGASILIPSILNQNAQNQAAPVTSPSKTDLLEVLKQLGELLKSGVLTQAEFDVKKKEILEKL